VREEKHTVGSIKNIFRNDEKYVFSRYYHLKNDWFFDEKYTWEI
jgi:hypothetical protein